MRSQFIHKLKVNNDFIISMDIGTSGIDEYSLMMGFSEFDDLKFDDPFISQLENFIILESPVKSIRDTDGFNKIQFEGRNYISSDDMESMERDCVTIENVIYEKISPNEYSTDDINYWTKNILYRRANIGNLPEYSQKFIERNGKYALNVSDKFYETSYIVNHSKENGKFIRRDFQFSSGKDGKYNLSKIDNKRIRFSFESNHSILKISMLNSDSNVYEDVTSMCLSPLNFEEGFFYILTTLEKSLFKNISINFNQAV